MFNEGECARGVKAVIEPRIGVKGGDERSRGRREKEKKYE